MTIAVDNASSLNTKELTNTQMNIPANLHPKILFRTLLTQVKAVPAEAQEIAFHLNTKFAHLIKGWENILSHPIHNHSQEEASMAYLSWLSKATEFVACLPKNLTVPDGISGEHVNPWHTLQMALGSNRTGNPKDIPQITLDLLAIAKPFTPHNHLQQDHQNLVELAHLCGLISNEAIQDFFLNGCNMSKTPAEKMDDFLLEMQGETMLGKAELQSAKNGALIFTPSKTRDWAIQRNTLYIEGFPMVSQFLLITHKNQICVIDPQHRPQTSITNLAEAAVEAITQIFGPETQVFEAYPEDIQKPRTDPPGISKITIHQGKPQWEFTPMKKIPELWEKISQALTSQKLP